MNAGEVTGRREIAGLRRGGSIHCLEGDHRRCGSCPCECHCVGNRKNGTPQCYSERFRTTKGKRAA